MNQSSALIIITRNRAHLLALCLDNLTGQTQLPDEIIIVDNDSSDRTAQVIASYQKNLPIKYCLEKELGRAAARNRGLQETNAAIILFTDDDCLHPKEWIATHLKLHTQESALAIGGPLQIYDPTKKHTYSKTIQFFFDDYINKGIFLALSKQNKSFNLFRFFFDSSYKKSTNPTHHLFTANISYKRHFFRKYGNYNSELITGEENALHNQAFKAGAPPFYFEPNLKVFHSTWPTFSETFKRYFEYGYFDMLSSDLTFLTLIKKSLFTVINCGKLILNRSKLYPFETIYLSLLSLAIYSGNSIAYYRKKLNLIAK